MSFINHSTREINCKIVYYGPGLCGKTTNLQCIYQRTNPNSKGKMISLATETAILTCVLDLRNARPAKRIQNPEPRNSRSIV